MKSTKSHSSILSRKLTLRRLFFFISGVHYNENIKNDGTLLKDFQVKKKYIISSMSYFSLKALQSVGGYNSIRFLFWFLNDVGRVQCNFPNIIGHIVHMGTDSRRCCFGLCFPQQPGNVRVPVSLLIPF